MGYNQMRWLEQQNIHVDSPKSFQCFPHLEEDFYCVCQQNTFI